MFSTPAEAVVNQINYQGKLADQTGQAVADTTYSIIYRLYTVPTGGSSIWSETANATTSAGLFSHMLGSVSPLTAVDFTQTLYLGVEVAGDGEMSPRKVIGTVPAAFEADNATTFDNLATTSFLRAEPRRYRRWTAYLHRWPHQQRLKHHHRTLRRILPPPPSPPSSLTTKRSPTLVGDWSCEPTWHHLNRRHQRTSMVRTRPPRTLIRRRSWKLFLRTSPTSSPTMTPSVTLTSQTPSLRLTTSPWPGVPSRAT